MCTSRMSDNSIDDEINRVKSEIMKIKHQRVEEREEFSENQATFCVRQHYCQKELSRLLEPSATTRSRCYTRAVQDLSSTHLSPYIMAREAELCQALHRVEITTNQLRRIAHYQDAMVDFFEDNMDEQRSIGKRIEEDLLTCIKFATVDVKGKMYEYTRKLTKQRLKLARLSGDDNYRGYTEDCRSIFSSERSTSMSSLFSTTSTISSVSSSSTSVSPSISNNNRKQLQSKQKRRSTMEHRISQVSSYFGLRPVANAA